MFAQSPPSLSVSIYHHTLSYNLLQGDAANQNQHKYMLTQKNTTWTIQILNMLFSCYITMATIEECSVSVREQTESLGIFFYE